MSVGLSDSFYKLKDYSLACLNALSSVSHAVQGSQLLGTRQIVLHAARASSGLSSALTAITKQDSHPILRCISVAGNALNICFPLIEHSAYSLGGMLPLGSSQSQSLADTALSILNIVNAGWPNRTELEDTFTRSSFKR